METSTSGVTVGVNDITLEEQRSEKRHELWFKNTDYTRVNYY